MADIDILGIGKATAQIVDLVKEPVRSLFGPSWNELASAWGDSVRGWRDMRRLERAARAVAVLNKKGISPKAVDPSILFPILDASSLVDDPDLRTRWDALLANAADPAEPVKVIPPFASMLGDLSPVEARLLDAMYDEHLAYVATLPRNESEGLLTSEDPDVRIPLRFRPFHENGKPFSRADLVAIGDMSFSEIGIAISNLCRLAVLAKTYRIASGSEPETLLVFNKENDEMAGFMLWEPDPSVPRDKQPTIVWALEFTELGLSFVRACRRK